MAVLTTPFKASGTTLGNKATSAGTAYTTFGELVDIEFGGVKYAKIDTSVLASLAKTSIASIPDSGDVTLNFMYVPGDPGVALITANAGATSPVTYYQIQLPDGSSPTTGTTLTFAAWVSSWAPGGFAIDGTPMLAITITITGLIAVVVGT